jgi:hypothetical protein
MLTGKEFVLVGDTQTTGFPDAEQGPEERDVIGPEEIGEDGEEPNMTAPLGSPTSIMALHFPSRA